MSLSTSSSSAERHLSASRKPSRLPKRFPVGTTYVVEGRGGEAGHLRVFSRYVVLPGGRRIILADDFGGQALFLARRRSGSKSETQAQISGKRRSGRAKKIMAGAGTARQRRR
jgi:hypothetical protein